MIRFHMQFDFGYECRLNSACRFLRLCLQGRFVVVSSMELPQIMRWPVNVNRPAMRERLQKYRFAWDQVKRTVVLSTISKFGNSLPTRKTFSGPTGDSSALFARSSQ